jgi:hypothetical protein
VHRRRTADAAAAVEAAAAVAVVAAVAAAEAFLPPLRASAASFPFQAARCAAIETVVTAALVLYQEALCAVAATRALTVCQAALCAAAIAAVATIVTAVTAFQEVSPAALL